MHILQKNVIDQLRAADSLRYSELQPRDIESSHFKYHLDQLVKDGLVVRKDRGVYSLTAKGKTFADRLSEHRVNPHPMPKLITYTLLEDDTHYYLYRKDKEPYLGLLNMVGGKMHVGETAKQASLREISEKTHIHVPTSKLSGVANIQISDASGLLTHATAYIYRATISETNESLIAVSKKHLPAQKDVAPDLLPLIEHIENSSQPFVIDLQLAL